jgi:hypothetical protein
MYGMICIDLNLNIRNYANRFAGDLLVLTFS